MYDDTKNGIAPGSELNQALDRQYTVGSSPYDDVSMPQPQYQPPQIFPNSPVISTPSQPAYNQPPASYMPAYGPAGANIEDDGPEPFDKVNASSFGNSPTPTANQHKSTFNSSCSFSCRFKSKDIIRVAGGIFSIFFLIYGIVMFSIPVALLNENREKYPELKLVDPDVSVPILHWFFIIFAVGFGCCFVFLRLKCWGIHIAVGLITIGFWIAYGCVAGLSRESVAAQHVYTNSSYSDYSKQVKNTIPSYRVYLYCDRYNNSGKHKGSCSTPGYYIYPSTQKDTTEFPVLQEYKDFIYRIQLQYYIVKSQRLKDTLDNAENAQLKNWPPRSYNRYYKCRTRTQRYMGGIKEDISVSPSGVLPKFISNSVRVATEIFWAGAYYCYTFAANAIAVIVPVHKALDVDKVETFTGRRQAC